METIFTALNLALFVGCLMALTRCHRDATSVERRRKQLEEATARHAALKAQMSAVSEAQEALHQQLLKLRGRFYAERSNRKPVVLEGEYTEQSQNVTPEADDVDPDLLAHIRLQTAPPKAPGT